MAERDEDGAVRGYLDWIFAAAADGEARWEGEGWNPKRMGELAQAAFLARAQALGFGLAVPWGDSEKFDFIVWDRPSGKLLRVQVKATGRLHRGGYDVQPVYSTRGGGKKTYTAADIDVLAAHVRIEGKGRRGTKEVWYLLPIAAIEGKKNLRFFPGLRGRDPRWEGYREGWEWLRG
jgi:hypothetical protein